MRVTWFGHSAFRLDFGGKAVLIDPFFTGNPGWGKGWEGPAEGVTHLLLTHGHNDHLGDSEAILKKTGAMLVANFEICMFLVGKGARIDESNSSGETPLITSVHNRNIPLIRVLLKAGANPDRADNSGRSARDYAALEGKGGTMAASTVPIAAGQMVVTAEANLTYIIK